MISSTITVEEEANGVSSIRRLSLKPRKSSTIDTAVLDAKGLTQDQPRRSSLASFSSKLWRTRKTQKVTDFQDQENRLGERFFDLPAEIQTHILSFLAAREILALRLTSRQTLNTIQSNSTTIALQVLRNLDADTEDTIPISTIYPPPSCWKDDAYLLQLLHRERVIQRQMHVVLTFLQTRVYMLKINVNLQCQHFSAYRAGLYSHLYKPAWFAQHFLESVRDLITLKHPSHSPTSNGMTISACSTCMLAAKNIVASYPEHELVTIYQFLQVLVLQLRAATRAPSFVPAIERKLRGWGYGPLPEQQLCHLIFLGGLQEVSKINEMEGSYGKRLAFVTDFMTGVGEAVKVNSIAWPLISSSDPVMPKSIDLSANVTKSLDPPYLRLTETMLESIPEIETFLLGPKSLMAQRITAEKLVDHQRELLSPYGWVQRLMANCYRSEDDKNFSTSRAERRGWLRSAAYATNEEDLDDDLPGIEPE